MDANEAAQQRIRDEQALQRDAADREAAARAKGPQQIQYASAFNLDPGAYQRLSQSNMPQVQGLMNNQPGYQKFSQEALRNGPSAWSKLAGQQQYAEQAKQTEGARAAVGSQQAAGRSALATQGGLSSGARERLAQQGTTDYLGASQGIARQGNINRLGIATTDEANRIQQLGMLPSMEQNRTNALIQAMNEDKANQFKLFGAVGQEAQNQNTWNQEIIKQAQENWRNQVMANAQNS